MLSSFEGKWQDNEIVKVLVLKILQRSNVSFFFFSFLAFVIYKQIPKKVIKLPSFGGTNASVPVLNIFLGQLVLISLCFSFVGLALCNQILKFQAKIKKLLKLTL